MDFDIKAETGILYLNLSMQLLLLLGAALGIFMPSRRIYPMNKKNRYYFLMWFFFYFIWLSNAYFIYSTWDSGIFKSNLRFFPAVPMMLFGTALLIWGILHLGSKNTSGLKDKFIQSGPYAFTRNPQYLGDFFLFGGIITASNSSVVLITHLMLILIFLIAPLAEEIWLQEEYGENYIRYKNSTSRFL